jgi:hypothetical protein
MGKLQEAGAVAKGVPADEQRAADYQRRVADLSSTQLIHGAEYLCSLLTAVPDEEADQGVRGEVLYLHKNLAAALELRLGNKPAFDLPKSIEVSRVLQEFLSNITRYPEYAAIGGMEISQTHVVLLSGRVIEKTVLDESYDLQILTLDDIRNSIGE